MASRGEARNWVIIFLDIACSGKAMLDHVCWMERALGEQQRISFRHVGFCPCLSGQVECNGD